MAINWNADGRVLLSRASTGDPVEMQIVGFMALPDGWHYGEGRAASYRTIELALYIVASMRNLGVSTFEVFPMVNGEVMVSAYCETTSIDITTTKEGNITYVVEKDDLEVAAQDDPVDFSVLEQAIEQKGWLACVLLDLSTRGTIATKRAGLPQLPSLTQTAQVYQLFSIAA